MARTHEPNARARRATERAKSGITVPQTQLSFLNEQKISGVLEPVVEEFGCVLEKLSTRNAGTNRALEIIVDYREGTDSLSLDTVAEISRALSAALDQTDDGSAPYLLEVSSPGAARALTEPRHWYRSIGRLIRITPADGSEKYIARLHDVTDTGPQLARKKNTKKGQKESYRAVETLNWDSISAAKVEIEFNR